MHTSTTMDTKNKTWQGIRVDPETRKLLALYKLEHELGSYAQAIRHAVMTAERIEGGA